MLNLIDDTTSNEEIPPTKSSKTVTQKALDWSSQNEWRLIPRIISLEEDLPLYYIEVVTKAI